MTLNSSELLKNRSESGAIDYGSADNSSPSWQKCFPALSPVKKNQDFRKIVDKKLLMLECSAESAWSHWIRNYQMYLQMTTSATFGARNGNFT